MPRIDIVNGKDLKIMESFDLSEMREAEEPAAEKKAKPQNNALFSLDTETTLKADNKTDKIFFTPLLQSGKPGAFINIKSKTPDNQHTLTSFKNNNYIYIDYNEDFKDFLYYIYDNFNPEFIQCVNDDYQFEEFINTCETNGYVKCKVAPLDYNTSFFTTVVKDKKSGKKTIKPLKGVDFTENRINKGIYSLKVSGFWRKTKKVKGMTLAAGGGLSIKVFSVLVSKYTKEEEEAEDEDYEAKQQTELKNNVLDMLDDDDEET